MAIENLQSAVTLLSQVARMSVNAGKGIAQGAGSGYVGMLNGVTVKLATHLGERLSGKGKTELQQACDELRQKLGEAARYMLQGKPQEAALKRVMEQLGLDKDPPKGKARPLITRSIALSVVKTINAAARRATLSDSLEGISGEKTIKESRADVFAKNMKDSFQRQSAFIDKIRLAFDRLMPDMAHAPMRASILAAVEQSFVFRKGQMAIADSNANIEVAADAPQNVKAAIAADLSAVMTRAQTPDQEFHNALASLYCHLMMTPDGEAALAELLENRVEPYRDVEQRPTMPSGKTPGAGWKKAFTFMKSIATFIYPPRNDGAATVYPAYQTWLLNKAAAQSHTTVEALTLDQLADFIEQNWEQSPKSFGGPETTHMGEMTTIHRFFEKLAQKNGQHLLSEGRIECNTIVDILKGDSDAQKQGVCRLMTMGVAEYFVPGKLYEKGGSLVALHEETFAYDKDGHEVTSRVAPKNRFAADLMRKQLASLAETELSRVDSFGRKQVLFKGIRFGNFNLAKRENDVVAQHAHYGKLIEQLVLANDTLRAGLKEGDAIDLPVYRVDMSEDACLRNCAQEYKLVIDGKNVTVRPQVAHFRVQTDGADLVAVGGKREWRMMSKADVEQNDRALAQLLDAAKKSDSMLAKSIAFQLENYWTNLKTRHGDGQGNIKLFAGYGAEMMQFGARIALLAAKLGSVPAFNCTGGRDRTGLMDVECKTLALHLANGKTLPKIKATGDDLRELRTTMRDKSGNQDIAREILLNDRDMYTDQVKGRQRRLLQDDPNAPALPATIRSNDGASEDVDWTEFNRTSGLEELYIFDDAEIRL